MSKQSHINSREIRNDTLIVGVDIGSKEHTSFFTTISGKKLGSIRFENSRRGFDEFWSSIEKAKFNGCCRDILLGFESTGPYGEPLQHYLLQKPVKLVQVNPMHTKRTKDICDNTPLKSDEKDSKVISDIIRIGRWISQVVPTGARADLRKLTNLRNKHVRDRTAHFNRLRQNHYLLFPEFSGVIKAIKSKTALYLLDKYPTPEDFKSLNAEKLGKELRKVSRGRFGIRQAEALIKAARTSIGIKHGADGILLEIRQILEQLNLMNGFLATVEEKIKLILKMVPESRNILSIKGIKEITAAAIIGEIGDFSGFRKREEILKFAGLNIFEISSGLKKGQKRITKVGRSVLRKTLYFAALNTIRKGGIMHDYYKRLVNKGKPPIKALIAVSRKLLRTIFSLVKSNSMFIENYHETTNMRKAA